MRVTVTGATGLIETRVVAALQERGDEVTALSGRPEARPPAVGGRCGRLEPLQRSRRRPRDVRAATASYTSPRVLVSASAVGY